VLTLKAEKHQESEKRDDGLLMSERRYGVFERKLALPADADSDKISAGFVNGVLTIRIGKNSKASASRRIPVDVG
jgi:HSP20 family protein